MDFLHAGKIVPRMTNKKAPPQHRFLQSHPALLCHRKHSAIATLTTSILGIMTPIFGHNGFYFWGIMTSILG